MPTERVRSEVESIAIGINEVATMLGVSPSHVRNMIKAGNLPYTKLGKRILIQRSAVLALFEPAQNGRRKQK